MLRTKQLAETEVQVTVSRALTFDLPIMGIIEDDIESILEDAHFAEVEFGFYRVGCLTNRVKNEK